MSMLFAPSEQKSTTTGQQQSSGTTSGSTSTQATLTPEMQQLMQQLLGYSNKSMTDPMGAMAPMRNAGLQNINASYANVPGQISSQMASRGYGSSGAMGDAMLKTNLARAGAQSGFEGQLAQMGQQQQQYGSGLAQQLLNSMKGTTTTADGTTSSSGTNSGTETKPGPSIFGTIMQLAGGIGGMAATGGGSIASSLLGGHGFGS